jgi:hypothetical protein
MQFAVQWAAGRIGDVNFAHPVKPTHAHNELTMNNSEHALLVLNQLEWLEGRKE